MFHLVAAGNQALRRRPGPGHVLSASRHGLGPEAVLPNAALAAESRSRRWESQAQSARREERCQGLLGVRDVVSHWREVACMEDQDSCLPLSQRLLEPRSDHIDDEGGQEAHLPALLHHITRADPLGEANHLSPTPHLPL